MKKIGFLGLGNMGLPMAKNLKKADFSLKGYDVLSRTRDEARACGIDVVEKMIEAVRDVDFIISMVPEGKHARTVYLGDEGVLRHASPSTIIIDCSTIDVETSREIHSAAERLGFKMLDAPVSGGVGGAEMATLTFMVGGHKQTLTAAEPVLKIMGSKIVYCGGPGNGEAAKICNNMLLAISMIGTCEAFALGRKLGLDDQIFFDVASKSSGRCWSLDTYCPVPGPVPASPANKEYKAGFAVNMMLKDLRLASAAAQSVLARIPLGQLSETLYSELSSSGLGSLDFSSIFKLIEGPRG